MQSRFCTVSNSALQPSTSKYSNEGGTSGTGSDLGQAASESKYTDACWQTGNDSKLSAFHILRYPLPLLLFTRYMSGEGGLTTCNLYKIKDVFSNQHRNNTKDICYKKNLQQNTYQIPAGPLLPQNDYIMYSRSSLRRQFRSL